MLTPQAVIRTGKDSSAISMVGSRLAQVVPTNNKTFSHGNNVPTKYKLDLLAITLTIKLDLF